MARNTSPAIQTATNQQASHHHAVYTIRMKRLFPLSHRATIITICLALLLVIGGIVGTAIGWRKILYKLQGTSHVATLDRSPGLAQFPEINTQALSPTRRKVIQLAQAEFAAQPAGTKYSQGAHEAWCADFVSWTMQQAGAPLKNPHTGSWRIPGTFTLREYYESVGRFKPANSGYQPRPGDVAIYRASPVFGDHTHIVLRNDDGMLTTVGGNENNKIRVFANQQRNYTGLLGYGVTE